MGRKIGAQIRAICEYVESHPGCKTTDIASALPGKTPQTGLTRLCRRAEGHGLLTMSGKRPMKLETLPNWRMIADRKKEKPPSKTEQGEVTKSPFSLLIAEWGRTCG